MKKEKSEKIFQESTNINKEMKNHPEKSQVKPIFYKKSLPIEKKIMENKKFFFIFIEILKN